jgi:hypothetical protein
VLGVPLGFAPNDVVTIAARPSLSGENVMAFYVDAIDRLTARQDVIAAGATDTLPLDTAAVGGGGGDVQTADGALIPSVAVLPGFFEAVGIPLTRGRTLVRPDVTSGVGVVVVNQTAARRLFGLADPIGRTITTKDRRTLRVVGEVADIRMNLKQPPAALSYAIASGRSRMLTLVARVRSRATATPSELRRVVSGGLPDTPVTAMWWRDRIDAMSAFRVPRFRTLVLGSFGVLGLMLAVVGVFSAVSFYVMNIKRELAVRMVYGAGSGSVFRTVGRYVGVPVAIGVAAALTIGLAAGRLVSAHIEGLRLDNPIALGCSCVAVIVTAFLSAFVPAWNATRLDLGTLLREESGANRAAP